MPPSFVAVTILNRGYLSRADVMFASLRRFHPDVPCLAVLIDEWPEGVEAPSHFEVMTLAEMQPADMWRRLFRYLPFERLLTWKSLAMLWALERHPEAESVLFLDSDMVILAPLVPLVRPLREASVVLSPHLLDSRANRGQLEQLSRVGVYNAACIGVARDRGQPFLDWYEEMLRYGCQMDLPRGLFYEQRWLDLVPSLFGSVEISRHPGVNVAYWNVRERDLREVDGTLTVLGQPVLFFHFSGWSPANPTLLSKHDFGDYIPAPTSPLGGLLSRYAREISASPYVKLEGQRSVYDFDSRGRRITDAQTLFYAEVMEELLPVSHSPYAGVDFPWEQRLVALLLMGARRLPHPSESPRQIPLYRTFCGWARKRLAKRVSRTSPRKE